MTPELEFLQNSELIELNKIHTKNIIEFLLKNDNGFSFVVQKHLIKSEPDISKRNDIKLTEYTVFNLVNYTFSTVEINDKQISFETGFNDDDFGTIVKVNLEDIIQIVSGNDIVLTYNKYAEIKKEEEKIVGSIERSKNVFAKKNNK